MFLSPPRRTQARLKVNGYFERDLITITFGFVKKLRTPAGSLSFASTVIDPTAFIHPAAIVTGDVTLGARVSVWPTAVIRGDSDSITIGDDSNVQDGTIIHVDDGVPTHIGNRVAIGHRAIVHGATIEDDCLIAMGAILLNGVHVGTGSIVGAGAVCPRRNAHSAQLARARRAGRGHS